MSRIHTQLYYPPLDEGQSTKIWETNLRKLQKRKRDTMQIDVEQILLFARSHFEKNMDKSTHWNGRQIRNACQAAAALTEHEAFGMNDSIQTPNLEVSQPIPRLEVRHFQKVDNAMRDFHEYMTNVCGEDFSGVAKMKNERDDDYEPPRRYQEHFGQDHHSSMLHPASRSDAYSPDDVPPYWGEKGYAAHRASPFSPHDQRSRQQWAPFSRDQERQHFA